MSFISTLTNQTFTNNGAYAFKSTGSDILDLFSQGVSSDKPMQKQLIKQALQDNPALALKASLYLRDVRNGMGNRDIFRSLIELLIEEKEYKLIKKIFKHAPEFGRWKDVIEWIGTNDKLDKIISKQISKNITTDALLCKWLPRQGDKAKYLWKALGFDCHGNYRHHIVSMCKTVEQQMCAKEWSAIKYEAVPSIANKKYAQAFLRNDSNRRTKFLEDATTGKTKMKSSVLYPHDIVKMIPRSWNGFESNTTADALWANLPNYMEKAVNVLPVIDTSGSMFSPANGTTAQCIDIAVGLGLYFAEHNTGSYKDVWMNFSSTPSAYKLQGSRLSAKAASLDFSNWGMSTGIDKAMEFVLKAAKENPEDTPKMIIIVSDMEFNRGVKPLTNFEYMKEQFAALGVTMPTILFWRVNVSSGSTPIQANDKGAIIVNGYSPSILKYILNGDITNYTPMKAMLEVIEPMYSWVDKIFKD